MKRFPTAFAERNRIVVAIAGLLAMTLVFAVTYYAEALPVIGGGKVHAARFAEAGGLREGNEVRVAGVKVGEVTKIGLDEDVVEVTFRVKDVRLGDQTSAAVKVKTLLGQKFLSLEPGGRGELDGPIPVERTTTPYDVSAALSDLSTTVGDIDTDQMAKSFDVLSRAFRDTPESVRTMVDGLADLSRTVSSRDEQLADLLASSSDVTETFADRNAELAGIVQGGDALLAELKTRRRAIHDMLTGTRRLAVQLRGLVADNSEQLRPALKQLDTVAGILDRNEKQLEKAVSQLGPYYRVLASATGNGHWVDSYVCGLFDATGAPVLQNDVQRTCAPAKGGGQ
ncbi:MCE family protein [Aeromicrobium sp. IC_218]|uniref:MCE family protein n=1 Tax=Aeromicrobium sp. IC_218 TaxID=2545468 RepID=UPI001039C30D|nr:MCE family protein [Aeromicrobium sp. IC_218]TCI97569.1 MCE family protein [Aeromicrobium sp. IC_218]